MCIHLCLEEGDSSSQCRYEVEKGKNRWNQVQAKRCPALRSLLFVVATTHPRDEIDDAFDTESRYHHRYSIGSNLTDDGFLAFDFCYQTTNSCLYFE